MPSWCVTKRGGMHSSMNYRCVMVHGIAEEPLVASHVGVCSQCLPVGYFGGIGLRYPRHTFDGLQVLGVLLGSFLQLMAVKEFS